ncbi:SH3 beta-barrel fold-containing protein [Catalinimonas alkaloidigena]|uniref:SH3 beta-barrel fold-containing protein n=1 Tax=Catalinimonas alkaloidigena TaxID=1075417 RepID=UPI0024075416|nr:SH3 beta-barrel fold-containing protein [Catalinimonas alkaloidigena]
MKKIDSVEGDPIELERIALSTLSDFQKYSKLTKVRFIFRYANNEYNRDRGRAGNISATRTATTNLSIVPISKHPRSRNSDTSTVRFYDFNRAGWRSFRRDNIVILTEVFSVEKNRWTTDLDEFDKISSMSPAEYAAYITRIAALNPDNANS